MKKILFLLLISGALLASSCTKNYAVIPNQTTYYDLPSTGWTTTDKGLNYTATIPAKGGNLGLEPDGILIYFSFDKRQSYEQIPEVYNNISFTYTNDGNNITLYAQSANSGETIPAPIALTAKIVLIPSN